MPWQERDWATWTDEERNRFLGTSGSGGGSTTTRGGAGRRPRVGGSKVNSGNRGRKILAFGLIAAFLAALYTGPVPIADPTSAFRNPTTGTHQVARTPNGKVPMSGIPATMRRGTYVTSRGRLGSGVSGVVIVAGRWGAGRWYRLATAPARDGSFRVRYLLDKPGLIHLRIALPDGTYLVAKTRVT